MKNSRHKTLILLVLVVMSIAHAASGQSRQTSPNSAQSSPGSGIRVSEEDKRQETRDRRKTVPIASCMAAADDLDKTRVLVRELESENLLLTERLETEKRTTALLTELNETRKSESEALRITVAAKNETIAAKDAVIASQDKLIETLKRKKASIWRRLGDVLIGAAAIAVLR